MKKTIANKAMLALFVSFALGALAACDQTQEAAAVAGADNVPNMTAHIENPM